MGRWHPGAGGGKVAHMTIGAALTQAREALGLTVQDVSLRTKIRGDYLRALENDAWEALPERTFTRAYLQRYAQELGLDPEPLLSRLDQALPPDPAAVRGDVAGRSELKRGETRRSEAGRRLEQGLASTQTRPARAVPAPSPARTFPLPPLLLGLLLLGGGAAYWAVTRQENGAAPAQQTTVQPPTAPVTGGTDPANTEPAPSAAESVNLSVSSVPTGARVYLDNRDLGVTPLQSFPVNPREKAELRVELAGYRPFRTGLKLVQGRNMRVTLNRNAAGSIVDVNAARARAAAQAARAKAAAAKQKAETQAQATRANLPASAAPGKPDRAAGQSGAGEGTTTPGTGPATTPPAVKTPISVTFTGESWTRVTDAAGRVLYQGTPPAGSRKGFPAGVTIRAGNGGAVQVSVNGQPAKAMGQNGQVVLKSY